MRILVTGASGFIGSNLIPVLKSLGHEIIAFSRTLKNDDKLIMNGATKVIHDLDSLKKIDVVVHLAARVHQMKETAADPFKEFEKSNVDFSVAVANKAIGQGISKFIFLSSVKVYGEDSGSYDENSPYNPSDPYGVSKFEAEKALSKLFGNQAKASLIILRIPMVYGPKNKGNILTMLKLAQKGWQLPLGAVKGKRSFVFVGNVGSAICEIITSPPVDQIQMFNLTDDCDVTSNTLFQKISQEMSGRSGVFYIPKLFFFILSLFRPVKNIIDRLFNSYQFKSKLFQEKYSWSPPFSFDDGVRITVESYKNGEMK
jgi:UDP-4-keto-D-QuiNAc 4-reductase